jgi:uncharacterized protein (DUF2252 family)
VPSAVQDHPTPSERKALGKDARAGMPRSEHGDWRPADNRAHPIALLEQQAAERVSSLVPLRYARMAASPFAFFRGAAYVMAADLANGPDSGLTTQLCGDAHLSNFGGFAGPDRRLLFDLNDFDETLAGPFEWDVKRLAASLAVAGRSQGFSRKARRRIVSHSVRSYRETMRRLAGMGNLEVWYERVEFEQAFARLAKQLDPKALRQLERNRKKTGAKNSLRALSKLTEEVDGERRIISDPPLIVRASEVFAQDGLSPEEMEERLRGLLSAYRRTLSGELRHLIDGYRPVDLARKVVGVGSVGTRAWIALMVGRDGQDPLFLQIKEAQRSVLEPFAQRSPFKNQGQRVVEGQRLMQAAGDILLGWIRGEGPDGRERDFYIRQLWDQKGSAEVEAMNASTCDLYGRLCGATLARAHARSGDRIAIAAYLGRGEGFDEALAEFAEAYADQSDADYAALVQAIREGRVEAQDVE